MVYLSSKQAVQIKGFLGKYEDYLFEKYSLHRDEYFRPYYFDEYSNSVISSDDLVQEVVHLDELLSILDSVNIE